MSDSDAARRIAVPEVQAALDQAQARWRAAATFLTELPLDRRRMYLGFTPPPGISLASLEMRSREVSERVATGLAAPANPPAFDWRNQGGQNFVTPVKDQGACGSCVAFGTTAAVEATVRIVRTDPGLAIDLSEASLFYCIGASQGRNCSTGWWPADALAGFQSTGVPDEACFPYTPGDQPCGQCGDWAGRVTKITNYHSLPGPTDMKTGLSSRGPMSACMSVYDDFFSYSGGVYHHVTGNLAGGHCICIVGYDDVAACWICKNSWGTTWGESGFFRIAYGECGIEGMVHGIDGIVMAPTPPGCLPTFLRFTARTSQRG